MIVDGHGSHRLSPAPSRAAPIASGPRSSGQLANNTTILAKNKLFQKTRATGERDKRVAEIISLSIRADQLRS